MMQTMPQLRDERIAAARAQVRALTETDGPIVVGPWLGEIGFELLYWIPFLRWILAEESIPAERLTVVSRGGCASWYGDLVDGYVEIFDYLSPDELRTLNRERMAQQAAAGPDVGLRRGQMSAKQYGIMRAEREILRRVGLSGATLLHPSAMFHLFRLYWQRRVHDVYARCARPAPIVCAPPSPIKGPYVAVKFYSSMACAERARPAELVRRLIESLADHLPVVVLDSGDRYDDHGAFTTTDARVTLIRDMEPRSNLAQQTAIIAHASAFVGTYGGFAYLAPWLGVPTTALYADRTFRDDHYQVAAGIFKRWRVRFDVSDLATGLIRLERDGLKGVAA